MKILIVFGTRPEAIKLAPVYLEAVKVGLQVEVFCTQQQPSLALSAWSSLVQNRIIVGAHSPYSNSLLKSFNHYVQEISEVVRELDIDLVIVQGDTLSALAGAMASFFMRIPLGHIEAGLTSKIKSEPFPEEVIRNLIDVQADLLFAPTQLAWNRLVGRIQSGQDVIFSGNSIVDALCIVDQKLSNHANSWFELNLAKFVHGNSRIITITMHRRESFGEPAQNFIINLKRVILENPDKVFVFIRHSNPAMSFIDQELGMLPNSLVFLTNPLDYLDMVVLLKETSLLITDSGGLQEEALVLGLRTIVLRNFTERPEILHSGLGILVSPSDELLFDKIQSEVNSIGFQKIKRINLDTVYGDGKSSSRIVSAISKFKI